MVHAFVETDPSAKIFMGKWDIKDGFRRMDCAEGEEWNFAYVLSQQEGKPVLLVVPTSLQMGWVESPPYFCAGTETARDVTIEYTETPVGMLPPHKFEKYVIDKEEYVAFPESVGFASGDNNPTLFGTTYTCQAYLVLGGCIQS
jgi:hypothetical protein